MNTVQIIQVPVYEVIHCFLYVVWVKMFYYIWYWFTLVVPEKQLSNSCYCCCI